MQLINDVRLFLFDFLVRQPERNLTEQVELVWIRFVPLRFMLFLFNRR